MIDCGRGEHGGTYIVSCLGMQVACKQLLWKLAIVSAVVSLVGPLL